MIVNYLNRIISIILIPLLMSTSSPLFMLRKAMNEPKELISISQSDHFAEAMYITAHRGVNSQAPENTIPAYEKAVELGYYSAECDIKLTSDNEWVLYHDPFLWGNFLKFGTVGGTDFETLRSYEYRSGADFCNYSDVRIPTLDEFLDVFVGSETRPQIEIKTNNFDRLGTVIDAIKAKGLEDSAIIISFDYDQLKAIRKYDSDIELWYLVYRISQRKIDDAKKLGNCWLSADFSLNNEKTISLALSQGVGLSLWTVDKVKDAEKLYDLGVRYIETDILCK